MTQDLKKESKELTKSDRRQPAAGGGDSMSRCPWQQGARQNAKRTEEPDGAGELGQGSQVGPTGPCQG